MLRAGKEIAMHGRKAALRGFTLALLLALVATPAIGVLRDDQDGDGVIDAVDDCLLAPHADQRDTDRDGIGNACDPDFDQNGVVDGSTSSASAG
jgi:hypothetical protein